MKAPRRQAVRAVLGSLVLGTLVLTPTATAHALHVDVGVTIPDQAGVGETLRSLVTMRDPDGAPIAGTNVVFYLDAEFAGVSGELEVGRALTDEEGVATLAYEPRIAGRHELRLEYVTPGGTEAEMNTMSLHVGSGKQRYQPAPGISIPGLGVELLIAVLATVWLILFGVALALVAIARAGTVRGEGASGAPA